MASNLRQNAASRLKSSFENTVAVGLSGLLNTTALVLGESDDVAFCRRLVMEHGVAAIPVSAFYAEGAVKNVVRFCFAKKDSTLDAGLERLAKAIKKAA